LADGAADGEVGYSLYLGGSTGQQSAQPAEVCAGRGCVGFGCVRQQVVEAQQELDVGVQRVAVDLDRGAGESAPDGGRQRVQRDEGVRLYGVHGVTQYRVQS
jgi:hypothetical protein